MSAKPLTHIQSLSHPAPGQVVRRLLQLAANAMESLDATTSKLSLGRIRGTGPGVTFGSLIEVLETAYPLKLQYPFEESDRVGGAVWDCQDILNDPAANTAIAKLQWREHADIPLHTHEHADRFIIVLDGRGFFHWSDQSVEEFDGSAVKTIAARSRDVFVFKRGLMHTFSTAEHPMTLLSVQSPSITFDDPRQFRLPKHHWSAAAPAATPVPRIACMLHPPEHTLHL